MLPNVNILEGWWIARIKRVGDEGLAVGVQCVDRDEDASGTLLFLFRMGFREAVEGKQLRGV